MSAGDIPSTALNCHSCTNVGAAGIFRHRFGRSDTADARAGSIPVRLGSGTAELLPFSSDRSFSDSALNAPQDIGKPAPNLTLPGAAGRLDTRRHEARLGCRLSARFRGASHRPRRCARLGKSLPARKSPLK